MKIKNAAPDPNSIIIGPNKKLTESIRLGLVAGVFYAPLTLAQVMISPLTDIGMALLKLILGLGLWFIVRITFIICGLVGMVNIQGRVPPPPAPKDDTAPA